MDQYLTLHNILYCKVLDEDSCPARVCRETTHGHMVSGSRKAIGKNILPCGNRQKCICPAAIAKSAFAVGLPTKGGPEGWPPTAKRACVLKHFTQQK